MNCSKTQDHHDQRKEVSSLVSSAAPSYVHHHPSCTSARQEKKRILGTYLLVGEVEELVKLNSPVGELPEGPLSLDGGSAGSVGNSVGL